MIQVASNLFPDKILFFILEFERGIDTVVPL
jgi:hypothetical protein